MGIKKYIPIILVLFLAVALGAIVYGNPPALEVFTPELLAEFNGVDGVPAYIAVAGKVYDVTDKPAFKDGVHQGNRAGQDLTEQGEQAPHGLGVIDGLEPIGIYLDLLLTEKELAAFDGRSGQPGYIAVNGLVYDVSNSARWRNGSHNGFRAGQDFTEAIKEISPHGVRVLERLPLVAVLVKE